MKTETMNHSGRRGPRVTATYQDTGIHRYQHNPLIEALPKISTDGEIMRQLSKLPAYKAAERTLPKEIRLQLIQTLRDVFIPLPVTVDLHHRFSAMIANGYVAKNPLARGYWPEQDAKIKTLVTDVAENRSAQANASGMAIFGIPGAGKSTTVENILSSYPQVITHSAYAGQPMPLTQLVYLKLDCPHDGSAKGLCLQFFQAVDAIVGTHYAQSYTSKRSTVYDLLGAMARVASMHQLGVLVIDEIQQLEQAKSGGKRLMLNFFCQLMNTIGLPVVLVGTYEAQAVLNDEFRQIRRNCGNGDLVWDKMQNDEWWKYFVECLWRYQYTQKITPCAPELLEALYDASQGVADFCVKIYIAAQDRAIRTGIEEVTPDIIHSVYRDKFRSAHVAMRALKSQDASALNQFHDLQAMNSLGTATALYTKPNMQPANPLKQPAAPRSRTATSNPSGNKPQPTGLMAAAVESLKSKTDVYGPLKDAGFIANPANYLQEADL